MKIAISKKAQKNHFLLWYLVISIYLSDSLIVATNVNTIYDSVAKVLFSITLVFQLLHFLITAKRLTMNKEFAFLVTTMLSLVVAMLYTGSDMITYLFKLMTLVYSYFLCKEYSVKEFYVCFRKLMKYLMLASLVLYIFKAMKIDLSFLPSIYNTKGIRYNTIFIANIFNQYSGIMRAQSIFWEAGVYAAYLCVTLIFELYSTDKIDYKYILLIMLSVFTTLSTTGMIVSFVIIISFIISRGTSSVKSKLYIAFLTILCVLALLADSNIVDQVFSKIGGTRSTFVNRWDSIPGNIEMIVKSPIFGVGPTQSRIDLTNYFYAIGERRSINNLNTILANYSVFGLIPFLYYLYYLIRFCMKADKSIVTNGLILVSLVLLLSSTGFHFSTFFMIIFMYRLRDIRPVNKLCEE